MHRKLKRIGIDALGRHIKFTGGNIYFNIWLRSCASGIGRKHSGSTHRMANTKNDVCAHSCAVYAVDPCETRELLFRNWFFPTHWYAFEYFIFGDGSSVVDSILWREHFIIVFELNLIGAQNPTCEMANTQTFCTHLYLIFLLYCSVYHKMNKCCFHIYLPREICRARTLTALSSIDRIKRRVNKYFFRFTFVCRLCVCVYRRRLPVCNSTIAIIVSSIPPTMNCIRSRARSNQRWSGNNFQFVQLFNILFGGFIGCLRVFRYRNSSNLMLCGENAAINRNNLKRTFAYNEIYNDKPDMSSSEAYSS